MPTQNPPLQDLRIATPCSAEWRWMYGNERVRFCGQCNLNVFNLSAMTRGEAEDLIRRADGRLCVRFYRRSDGTILTADCPVGLRAVKEKARRARKRLAAAAFGLLSYLGFLSAYKAASSHAGEPFSFFAVGKPVMGDISEPAPDPVFHNPVMGKKTATAPDVVFQDEAFLRSQAISKTMPIFYASPDRPGRADIVSVRIIVSETGAVVSADCVSKTEPILARVAEEAARRWTYKPLLMNGRPARMRGYLTFKLSK